MNPNHPEHTALEGKGWHAAFVRHPLRASLITAAMAAVVAGGAGFGLARWSGAHDANGPGAHQPAASGPADAGAAPDGRRVLYWYDPMVPTQHFDKPGRSPFMDMDLVPKYADAQSGAGVSVDPRLAQSLGLRIATVERRTLAPRVDAVAQVGFDERAVAVLQARSAGFVERVQAHAPGDVVAAGAPLAEVLVPDWAGAQQEYLAVRAAGDAGLAAAARQRLVLLGMPEALIARVERERAVVTTTTITAPIGGVIQELNLRAGMTLAPGMTLARLNGLASVWLEAAVPEAQAAVLERGRAVQASFAAYPGQRFTGKVDAVLPEANRDTRTLRVRMVFANPQLKLRPGMFAQVTLDGAREDALVVPSEAVIRTGKRTLVFVAEDGGRYRPVAVELGDTVDGNTVVRSGVNAGQRVVASGQFLIDSEASVSGIVAQAQANGAAAQAQAMPNATSIATSVATPDAGPSAAPNAPASAAAHAAPHAPIYEGVGKIVDLSGEEWMLEHAPIPALKWGAMTMGFKPGAAQAQGARLKPGDRVVFTFHQDDDGFTLDSIAPAGPESASHAPGAHPADAAAKHSTQPGGRP